MTRLSSVFDPKIEQMFKQSRTAAPCEVEIDGTNRAFTTPFPSPVDWRDVFIYQILVDRFNNPAESPRESWNAKDCQVFQGGTFEGIRAKLDYLKKMGVGAIWLSPVLKNCVYNEAYHGYGIQDFLAVEPRFCSDPEAARKDPDIAARELRRLVDEAHARGIYVVFDIVLHHVGDVFEYVLEDGSTAAQAPGRDEPYSVRWRDENGDGNPKWDELEKVPQGNPDVGVFPTELRTNDHFRRCGEGKKVTRDFMSLKGLVTDGTTNARDVLTRSYQYMVAKFDVDALRIDSFQYVEPEFGRQFCHDLREFALSIGKKNFFTFVEVYEDEDTISHYVGAGANEDSSSVVGSDAALDFPFMSTISAVIKGSKSPADLADLYDKRAAHDEEIRGAHAAVGDYYVTFLDNHDQKARFYCGIDQEENQFVDQVFLGLACLFTLRGVPCVYYGTEQGFHGQGDSDGAVREAQWGAPDAFSTSHPFYRFIQKLNDLRRNQSTTRYGRQYFRATSQDAIQFEVSGCTGSTFAFSRILGQQELLVVVNPNLSESWKGQAIVDSGYNPAGTKFDLLLSNKDQDKDVSATHTSTATACDGQNTYLEVSLHPGEVQIWKNRR